MHAVGEGEGVSGRITYPARGGSGKGGGAGRAT